MKKINLLFVVMTMLLSFTAGAQQAPAIEWAKAYGGSGTEDRTYSVVATRDGGYVFAGETWSEDGDAVTRPKGRGADVWLVKVNDTGAIQWQKYYSGGGNGSDRGRIVRQTTDGGYVIGATTFSENGNDITDKRASFGGDYWVIKTDDTGRITWSVTLGSKNNEEIADIHQTADGGYIVAGNTFCSSGCTASGDITRFAGIRDYWIVKLNSTGQIVWQKTYGGSQNDAPAAIKQTTDGGYILVGYTASANGDVTNPSHGNEDYWIVKLDDTGRIAWQKTYGGTKFDYGQNVIQNRSGGYVVVGYASSDDGDINTLIHGMDEYWVLGLDDTGKMMWQYAYGSSKNDRAYDLLQTSDGGYVISGGSMGDNNDGDKTYGYGYFDCWLIKTDSIGTLEWEKTVPGNGHDYGYALTRTTEGGYVAAGTTQSKDVTRYNSGLDLFLVKFAKAKIDSVRVTVAGGGPAAVTTNGGTLQLQARVFPLVSSQQVVWSLIPGTGTASVDANGLVTASLNGTVWAKAVSVDDITKSDSLEITLSGQTVPVDSVVVTTQNNATPEITVTSGTLQMEATVYPLTAVQSVTWSIVPGTGTAAVNGTGLVTAQTNGTVWVKAVSVSNPAKSDSLQVTIDATVSVHRLAGADQILVYPNPAQHSVYITGISLPVHVILTDVYGRTLKEADLQPGLSQTPARVDISNLAPGVYILHLKGSGADITHKLTTR